MPMMSYDNHHKIAFKLLRRAIPEMIISTFWGKIKSKASA
jgi:hypothetical protein